jgi:hypothetical protein
MTPIRSEKQVLPWATERPAPHFGKPSGLLSGSWKQSEIMERISETRHEQERDQFSPLFEMALERMR